MRRTRPARIWYTTFVRDRRELLPLFRLADDSEQQIAGYLYLGEVLFAAQAEHVLGHVQIIENGRAEFELKSIAVAEPRQRQGIGERLVGAAVRYCRERNARRLFLRTSLAASDAIRFYLCLGFRICGYKRDVFTTQLGYPEFDAQTSVPLSDAIELELQLNSSR